MNKEKHKEKGQHKEPFGVFTNKMIKLSKGAPVTESLSKHPKIIVSLMGKEYVGRIDSKGPCFGILEVTKCDHVIFHWSNGVWDDTLFLGSDLRKVSVKFIEQMPDTGFFIKYGDDYYAPREAQESAWERMITAC